MKTYDSEKKELVDWMRQKDDKYFEAAMKEIREHGVKRDSKLNYEHHLDVQEYNRRLRELKKKYGVE
mgnify:CR=1 FL=1